MVDIKTQWNEQNIKEYVRYTVFTRSKAAKIALIAFAVCWVLILSFCLTAFFAFGYDFALVFALMIVVLAVVYTLFFVFTIKNAAKNILKANAESELNRVMISNDDIIGFNNEEPIGTINWNKMADIYFDDKAQTAYLSTEGNAVLILECKNILSGTAEELKDIIGTKRNELSKKA